MISTMAFLISKHCGLKRINAFTLTELVVIVAITVILFGSVFLIFSNRLSTAREDANISQIVQVLRDAQLNAVSRFQDAKWGVYFDVPNKKFTLFAGESYALRSPQYDSVFSLSASISNIALNGGGSEIVFNKITGETPRHGVIEFTAKSGRQYIIIKQLGTIDLQ